MLQIVSSGVLAILTGEANGGFLCRAIKCSSAVRLMGTAPFFSSHEFTLTSLNGLLNRSAPPLLQSNIATILAQCCRRAAREAGLAASGAETPTPPPTQRDESMSMQSASSPPTTAVDEDGFVHVDLPEDGELSVVDDSGLYGVWCGQMRSLTKPLCPSIY